MCKDTNKLKNHPNGLATFKKLALNAFLKDDESSSCDIKSIKSLEIDDIYEDIPDISEEEILGSARRRSHNRSGNLKSMQV